MGTGAKIGQQFWGIEVKSSRLLKQQKNKGVTLKSTDNDSEEISRFHFPIGRYLICFPN